MSNIRTYCGLCGDSGAVTIWHPLTLCALRAGGKLRYEEAAVACKCKRGSRFSRRLKHGDSVQWLDTLGDRWWHVRRTIRNRKIHGSIYDPAADVTEHGTDLLRQFVSSDKPANYVDAFDEFNAAG